MRRSDPTKPIRPSWSAWSTRVEVAILALDLPRTEHAADIQTPLTLLKDVIQMQHHQAEQLYCAVMT